MFTQSHRPWLSLLVEATVTIAQALKASILSKTGLETAAPGCTGVKVTRTTTEVITNSQEPVPDELVACVSLLALQP